MLKINLQSVTSHFKKNERTRYTHKELHPTREWLIGLTVCVVLVALGAAQSAHQFMVFKNVNTQGGIYDGAVTVYNEQIVARALSIFSVRNTAFVELKANTPAQAPDTVEVVATSSPEVATSTPVSEPIEAVNSISN